MTRATWTISVCAALLLSACGQPAENAVRRYQSLDKNFVFIIDGNRSYLGHANYPPDKNVTETYGLKTENFSDAQGNTCASYNGITISKSAAGRFVCNGTEFVRSEVTDPTYGKAFRYKSICWGFANGACKVEKSGPNPSRVVEYDVLPDGRLVNLYLAGYATRDKSNTLGLVSKDAL